MHSRTIFLVLGFFMILFISSITTTLLHDDRNDIDEISVETDAGDNEPTESANELNEMEDGNLKFNEDRLNGLQFLLRNFGKWSLRFRKPSKINLDNRINFHFKESSFEPKDQEKELKNEEQTQALTESSIEMDDTAEEKVENNQGDFYNNWFSEEQWKNSILPFRPKTLSISKPELCKDSKFDTITMTKDGTTYVFKGKYYWKIWRKGIVSGNPRRISDDWDGLPDNLDASVTLNKQVTYFFKGDKCWRFTNRKAFDKKPKVIKELFPGIPDYLDAAMQWTGSGKIYFFKGRQYWRYDPTTDPSVSDLYPKVITKQWTGLPRSIDAAFQWKNNYTYFFKDQRYYRYDDLNDEVDRGDWPSFPRGSAHWWFNCPHATNMTVPEPEYIQIPYYLAPEK